LSIPMFDYVLSFIVSVFLLVYLGWAMFKPERF
jgi:K+-transporting ATPase KdpF subunit